MLYIVGTPIGNLSDMTLRAIDTLKSVDYILCEDTRTSKVLLEHYEIKNTLHSYHKYNETESLNTIVRDLQDGKNIALISDAGMPIISDPGSKLIQSLIEHNLEYTVLAGPSAFLNAFILSGMPSPFTFVGFLPEKNAQKRELCLRLKDCKTTLIFYLSPHSLDLDVQFLFNAFGNKKVAFVREITKKFEDVSFSTLEEGYKGLVKGEFVVLLDNSEDTKSTGSTEDIPELLKHYISVGFSKNDAIKMVASDKNLKKNEVYKYAIDL